MSNKSKKKRYSRISDHKRNGKILSPPMATLPGMVTKSWLNDQLPEMLWAVLIISTFDRKNALEAFRIIASFGRKYKDQKETNVGLTLTELSKIDEETFRKIIEVVTTHPLGYTALRPLLFFKDLPGYDRWKGYLDTSPQTFDWETVSDSVKNTIDHQSQQSTDCRWLTILFKIAAGKIQFQYEMEETVKEIIEYPNRGDMKKVRPSIRAMEMAFRMDDSITPNWPESFWKTCYENTPCIRSVTDSISSNLKTYSAFKHITDLFSALELHSYNTSNNTAVDSKHDTVFGICFFSLSVLEELCRLGNNHTILARFALRSLVESYVTLSYLIYKNQTSLWDSYRVYGSGQAKLAFLKIEEKSEDLPDYIKKSALESLANEDMYQEYLSINIGHWDNTNLRKMAVDSGVKEIYDRYYTWTSSYLHAQWGSIRDSVYTTCLNPLHRLHRIPRIHARTLDDVIPDACKLINNSMEMLNKIYPSFNERLKIESLLKG